MTGLIDAIGEVEYTAESKAKIDAARDACDALTDAQKALVGNCEALETAEVRYAELKAAAETPDSPTDPTRRKIPPIPTRPPATISANGITWITARPSGTGL